MSTSFTYNCPHCHTSNKQNTGTPAYCSACGHRTDVALANCDCQQCRELQLSNSDEARADIMVRNEELEELKQ
jgi:hypothetical protein